MTTDNREKMSALSHFIGVIFGIIGTILLITLESSNQFNLIAYSIFGISIILLYSASTVYHITDSSKKIKKVLRRIDHMMIYVLIAGTYTPICLVTLLDTTGKSLLIIIWSLALVGIFMKFFWLDVPRKLTSSIYIGMGWAVIFTFRAIENNMPTSGLFWLMLGGIAYTIGGVIYGTKKPNLKTKWFGFHELFHIFTLMGTVCHYVLMYKLI